MGKRNSQQYGGIMAEPPLPFSPTAFGLWHPLSAQIYCYVVFHQWQARDIAAQWTIVRHCAYLKQAIRVSSQRIVEFLMLGLQVLIKRSVNGNLDCHRKFMVIIYK